MTSKPRPWRSFGSWVALAALAVVAWAQGEDPLDRLSTGKSGPGWDGVELGISLVKAERLVGTTLAISPGSRLPVCSEFAASADHNGLRLVFGFPSARPGAKVESLWVQFGGEQIAASRDELVVSLLRRFPEARWIPDPEHPQENEQSDPTPVFDLGGSPPSVAKITPREGIQIARRDCLSKTKE
ncbi:MAG TPA: hypothetical protein VLA66_02340 [Thermoanaerobaculia bacterium]|nr:hypothetical protein [Thermoanaerobaculia bacterium]